MTDTEASTVVENTPEPGEQLQTTGETAETPSTAGERPSWLPEKFQSPEDMAKAYADLETKLGSGQEKPPAEADNATTETPAEDTNAEDAATGDLNFDQFNQEFAENGELGEESYKKLEAAGIPKAMVDQYIDAMGKQAAASVETLYKEAGGKDAYEKMVLFAQGNMSAEEIEAFDKAVTSGNMNSARLAVRGLRASYEATNGVEADLVNGDNGSSAGADAYTSMAMVQADMRSERYATDPAFRQQVMAKIGRSNI